MVQSSTTVLIASEAPAAGGSNMNVTCRSWAAVQTVRSSPRSARPPPICRSTMATEPPTFSPARKVSAGASTANRIGTAATGAFSKVVPAVGARI